MDNSFFYESANERKVPLEQLEPVSSFGSYQEDTDTSFDSNFEKVCKYFESNANIDIKRDISSLLTNPVVMESYRKKLAGPVIDAYLEANPNDPHASAVVKAFNEFWDNKISFYTESVSSVMNYLPISTLEFPVLTKQWYSSVINDIIETRTTKTPAFRRHVRTTYVVNNRTGEKAEYPKCFFNGEWKKFFDASRGHPIREEVVEFDNGRLNNFEVVRDLTDGDPQMEKIGLDFKVIGIKAGGKVYMFRGNGLTVSFGEGGLIMNGKIDTTFDGTRIKDTLLGQVDYEEGTVSMASTTGVIEGVVFTGHLADEKNMHSLSVTERREIKNFTVPSEGPRYQMPFSIEEIEDAAALLDINYYQRMVDEMVKVQEMNECQSVMQFLDDEFKKYAGIDTDLVNLESFARTYVIDLKPPRYFAGDPFEFMTNKVQFQIGNILQRMIDALKLEGISFVISGNPMATRVLNKFTEWKMQNGTNMGGINVNHSYGFATNLGANVRVVASNIFDAYSVDPYESKDADDEVRTQRELILHITGFPTDKEHISFEHIKYTSHLFTNADSAYLSPQSPGGAYKIVTMFSRFTDIAIQGIQADIVLLNSDLYYQDPPTTRAALHGFPWGSAKTPVTGL